LISCKPVDTQAILFAHKDFNDMNKTDKIRACYQHCALLYVNNERMTNQTLRERFKIKEENYSIASRIMRDTLEASLIKLENPDNKSKKYTTYVPFWACFSSTSYLMVI